jgi:hypothetical protein
MVSRVAPTDADARVKGDGRGGISASFPPVRLAGVSLGVVVVCGCAIAVAAGARQASRGLPEWATGPLASLSLHLTAAQFWMVLIVMSAG